MHRAFAHYILNKVFQYPLGIFLSHSKFKDLKTKFTKTKLKYWVFPSYELLQVNYCQLLI